MPLRIIDETSAANVIEVADGGTRIGVNGAADTSAVVTVAGVTFVAGNNRFASATVPGSAINPTTGTITVSSGSTTTVTTPVAAVSSTDTSTDVTALSSSSFGVGRQSGSGSVKYCSW